MAPTRLLACPLSVAALTLILASGVASAATGGQRKRPPAGGHLRLSSRLTHGVCTVAGLPQPAFGSSPPVVPSRPTRLAMDWTPGLNDRSCKIVRTSSRGAQSSPTTSMLPLWSPKRRNFSAQPTMTQASSSASPPPSGS